MKGNLILERHIGESIIIELENRQVEVSVIKSNDKTVRLSIQAEPDIKIIRKEIAI